MQQICTLIYTRNISFIRKTIYCFALNNYICESGMMILTLLFKYYGYTICKQCTFYTLYGLIIYVPFYLIIVYVFVYFTNTRLLLAKIGKIYINVVVYKTLKNSLIIHEENTKKNHKRVVSVYVIQIRVDLHKL